MSKKKLQDHLRERIGNNHTDIEPEDLTRDHPDWNGDDELDAQAADRIEQLETERDTARAEVERLREGIKTIEDIAHESPELNVNNYDHDQVCELNTAMIEVYTNIIELLKEAADG